MNPLADEFIGHEPCPACGSSDALSRWADGHAHCYSQGCTYREPPYHIQKKKKPRFNKLVAGEVQALHKRHLTRSTCEKWDYRVGRFDNQVVHIANYRNHKGDIVAQKIRFADKSLKVLGNPKIVTLYGQWLWRDSGKMVIITEGEIDALSVSQLQNHKWPVVSVPNGAQGAKKAIQRNLDWLEQFETVVFMFDNDKQGREAAAECALLLSPGKAKIASLPLKDANDMLVAGREKELIDAIWEAKTFRPDGIVQGSELWEVINQDDDAESIPYPWIGLNEKTHGLRKGELVTFTAGSGIGKSLTCREIAYHLLQQGQTIGYIALEENVRRTALGLMGLHLSKPLHLNREGVSGEDLRLAFNETLGTGRVFFYDHFGSIDSENLLRRIRFLARGFDCDWIILDHLSIVVSGIGDGDERRLIDNTMTALRSLVEALGIGLILVSHLKRPEGNKGHEEGAQTSLSQLRGSAGIAQLSDLVIGLERNQQDEKKANLTLVRVLKNRFSGETGVACYLKYDPETGRLSESNPYFPPASIGDGGHDY
jgi:twinkle protein